jgi:PAS domain S-box-containing protein
MKGSTQMSRLHAHELTGVELHLEETDVLTSKTDLRGVITYANDVFVKIALYEADELYGAPHSLIRHPAMPRSVFYLMWKTIESGKEFFGYVVNRAKNGDHYWVLAHIVPDLDPRTGEIIGYHSTRRRPSREGIELATKVYAAVSLAERKVPKAQQVEAGVAAVTSYLAGEGMSYEQWIFDKINKWEL